ncbi:MAG: mechanosensitive ion channel domain-containing protein [Candidatus Nanohalobium sp.]
MEALITQEKIYIQLAKFFFTLLTGVIITRAVLMPLTKKAFQKRGDLKASHSFENLAGITGLFLSLTIPLQVGGLGDLATIIGAVAAALTVAVGFGMRDQVASVVGGIFIHLDNPFIKGDYIKTGETSGKIKEIKLRATVLEKPFRNQRNSPKQPSYKQSCKEQYQREENQGNAGGRPRKIQVRATERTS